MDVDLKQACVKASMKLGGGLLLVAAMIGVRIVTAAPDGIESDVAELEAIESELAAEAAETGSKRPEPVAAEDDSIVSRLGASVMDRLPSGSTASRGPDPERLVSCRLGGSTQFMRAGDCLSRGGDSTDFDPKK